MPRFHFNVFDGVSLPDEDGMECPDWDAARVQAIAYAGEILKDTSQRLAIGEQWHMEVTDERGLVLFRLDFSVLEAPTLSERRRRPDQG